MGRVIGRAVVHGVCINIINYPGVAWRRGLKSFKMFPLAFPLFPIAILDSV